MTPFEDKNKLEINPTKNSDRREFMEIGAGLAIGGLLNAPLMLARLKAHAIKEERFDYVQNNCARSLGAWNNVKDFAARLKFDLTLSSLVTFDDELNLAGIKRSEIISDIEIKSILDPVIAKTLQDSKDILKSGRSATAAFTFEYAAAISFVANTSYSMIPEEGLALMCEASKKMLQGNEIIPLENAEARIQLAKDLSYLTGHPLEDLGITPSVLHRILGMGPEVLDVSYQDVAPILNAPIIEHVPEILREPFKCPNTGG